MVLVEHAEVHVVLAVLVEGDGLQVVGLGLEVHSLLRLCEGNMVIAVSLQGRVLRQLQGFLVILDGLVVVALVVVGDAPVDVGRRVRRVEIADDLVEAPPSHFELLLLAQQPAFLLQDAHPVLLRLLLIQLLRKLNQ